MIIITLLSGDRNFRLVDLSRAKFQPIFLSYLKTLIIDLVPGIEPTISRSEDLRSTNWTELTMPDCLRYVDLRKAIWTSFTDEKFKATLILKLKEYIEQNSSLKNTPQTLRYG